MGDTLEERMLHAYAQAEHRRAAEAKSYERAMHSVLEGIDALSKRFFARSDELSENIKGVAARVTILEDGRVTVKKALSVFPEPHAERPEGEYDPELTPAGGSRKVDGQMWAKIIDRQSAQDTKIAKLIEERSGEEQARIMAEAKAHSAKEALIALDERLKVKEAEAALAQKKALGSWLAKLLAAILFALIVFAAGSFWRDLWGPRPANTTSIVTVAPDRGGK